MNSHIHKNFEFFEIIKWEQNRWFGKKDLFHLAPSGHSYIHNKKEWLRVDESTFDRKESCYVLAYWMNMDHDELTPDLKYVGNRPFKLTYEELNYFHEAGKTCQYHIEEELKSIDNE